MIIMDLEDVHELTRQLNDSFSPKIKKWTLKELLRIAVEDENPSARGQAYKNLKNYSKNHSVSVIIDELETRFILSKCSIERMYLNWIFKEHAEQGGDVSNILKKLGEMLVDEEKFERRSAVQILFNFVKQRNGIIDRINGKDNVGDVTKVVKYLGIATHDLELDVWDDSISILRIHSLRGRDISKAVDSLLKLIIIAEGPRKKERAYEILKTFYNCEEEKIDGKITDRLIEEVKIEIMDSYTKFIQKEGVSAKDIVNRKRKIIERIKALEKLKNKRMAKPNGLKKPVVVPRDRGRLRITAHQRIPL